MEEVETKMEDCTETLTELQCTTDRQCSQTMELTYKIDDIENRAHRNNVRLRGIPEAAGGAENRVEVVRALTKELLTLEEFLSRGVSMEIERVHHPLGKPPNNQSRDVVARFLGYNDAELLLRRGRERKIIQYQDAAVSLYQDLLTFTLVH